MMPDLNELAVEMPAIHSSLAGSFRIGDDMPVNRLGFGAMRITGQGVWGDPPDRAAAIELVRSLPALGVNLIDTADSYGPHVSEELIHEALHPYPAGLVVATKAGLVRSGPDLWDVDCDPTRLRASLEASLERLGVERIDLFQLHRIDRAVPRSAQFELLAEVRDAGLVRHVGLSEVTIDDVEAARAVVPIATVQNRYSVAHRDADELLDYCEEQGIGFLPWFPLDAGSLAAPGGALAEVAAELDRTPAQVALAWLLQRSPVLLPIPGTGSLPHLSENVGAASIEFTAEQVARIDAASTALRG